jgi:hypothetical protein
MRLTRLAIAVCFGVLMLAAGAQAARASMRVSTPAPNPRTPVTPIAKICPEFRMVCKYVHRPNSVRARRCHRVRVDCRVILKAR